ncbi:sulfatase-like hydrolase/transferase [Roseibacillus persicicus]|uniref:sulfatase-like hydrolase/transferase n=1 Tax=Roseibacillus persicicus TaxID=454148 RepID=UPI00280E5F2B|nr:sulfatase-like hydrolase/transferase [Roseibacillus persicicus]MDQ8191561.1 sulfatase-like hydrolase/transferase [Roseibacillus persicicus]
MKPLFPYLLKLSLVGQLGAVTLPVTSFPNDGVTATYTTADSLLTFSTTNFFSGTGNFMGDGGAGATANLVNAYNDDEELTIELDPGTSLSDFTLRWTTTTITITGFASDPGTTIGLTGGIASWNESLKELTLTTPWDAGTERLVSFANASASEGATLVFSFGEGQATFTQFSYQEPALPLPDPLVHYSFDDATVSGSSLTDLSPNNHTGTLVSSASAPTISQSGLFEQSFGFAADDDPDGIVTIPSGVVPSGTSARTFSLWFNQSSSTGQSKLFGYGAGSAGRAFDVGLEGGGIRLRHFGGFITYGSNYDFDGTDAGWHHVAVRVNADASTFADVDVFLDGSLLTPQAGGATAVTLDTAAALFAIGSSTTPGAAFGFDGLIDEFRIYDSAIGGRNIAELAEAPPRPTILTFEATPQNRIPAGSEVTLSWTTENATNLTLEPGGLDVTGQTSVTVTPTEKTTYTLTASDEVPITDSESLTIAIGDQPFPNIVVFFLDDFGWADWEQNGASTGSVFYETPNMNRMAQQGLYFPNGYASTPVCSPTRGALMSGQAPALNKLTDWITGSGDAGQVVREAEWVKKLPTDLPNWPRVLSDCGYRAIHVGKWHLGSGTEPEAEPLNHGFDINIGGNQFGTPPAPERYFASANGFSALPNLGPEVAPEGSYLTDVLTEQAVEQIKDAAASDTAFAMYLSHYAVHTPIQAPAATVAKYQDKLANNPGMDWQGQDNPTYAAMIEHVDRSLGAILDTLEDPDGDPLTDDSIADNTLVVLTADNGGLLSATSNRPLRDGKGGSYEGGIREPWIFWMPGTVTQGISPEPIVTHDLFPTLLSQAGVPTPAGHDVSGQDLSPLLTGQPFKREHPVTFHYPHWSPANQIGEPYSAIRMGDWKLIYTYANKSWELYNLANNPGETNSLTASETDRHAVMSWLLSQGLENLDANYPRNVNTLAEEPPLPLVTPNNDADGDGQSDLDEAIQGTDAGESTSFFSPTFDMNDGTFSFQFTPAAERRYRLEASNNLEPDSWTTIDDSLPLGDPDGLLGRRFYRVVTEFP